MTIQQQLKLVLSFHKDFEKYRDNYKELSDKIGTEISKGAAIEIEKRDRVYKRELHVLSEKVGGIEALGKLYKELIEEEYIEQRKGNYYITAKGEKKLNENFWNRNDYYNFKWLIGAILLILGLVLTMLSQCRNIKQTLGVKEKTEQPPP